MEQRNDISSSRDQYQEDDHMWCNEHNDVEQHNGISSSRDQ